MAAITLEVAKKHLEMWLEAESEVAINQSYTIGGKSFTRANLAEIRKQIEYWSNKVAELENLAKKKGRNRVYRILRSFPSGILLSTKNMDLEFIVESKKWKWTEL